MKIITTALSFVAIMTSFTVAAQPVVADIKQPFPQTNWASKNSSDAVTIQNGAGTPIIIVINVTNGPGQADGVNVKNCGETTYIKAGSSSVCQTNDSQNPVTLTSNSVGLPSVGTYQIKPQ